MHVAYDNPQKLAAAEPGKFERVRQARREAGLTMAQVGGEERSRTAIYLIEVGRTRPTPETLQLIAERTGKPVEYFLPGSSDPSLTVAASDEETQGTCLPSEARDQTANPPKRARST